MKEGRSEGPAQSTAAALSPSRKDAWASSPRLGKELWDADRKPP